MARFGYRHRARLDLARRRRGRWCSCGASWRTAGPVAFTVDGPRGPARVAQPGAVWLAGATGHPVLPFHIEAEPLLDGAQLGSHADPEAVQPRSRSRSASRSTCPDTADDDERSRTEARMRAASSRARRRSRAAAAPATLLTGDDRSWMLVMIARSRHRDSANTSRRPGIPSGWSGREVFDRGRRGDGRQRGGRDRRAAAGDARGAGARARRGATSTRSRRPPAAR